MTFHTCLFVAKPLSVLPSIINMQPNVDFPRTRLSTGVAGLDRILRGGLLPQKSYLLRGGPGSGKTTLGLHFLSCELTEQSSSIYITLGESAAQIQQTAQLIGIQSDQLHFLDLSPTTEIFTQQQSYDIFSPSEVERSPITKSILDAIATYKPQRVVIDSMTQFRYLSVDPFQFRQQSIALLRYLTNQGATVLFTSEASIEAPDEDLQFISDGILQLTATSAQHTIQVLKFRGSSFISGKHALRLSDEGMTVFPKLEFRKEEKVNFEVESVPSGIPEMDELLNGGLERGTISLITGPSGVGKSTLGLQFAKESAGRGDRTVVYLFEEAKETLIQRCESVNIPVKAMLRQGTLSIVELEPLNFSPDEFVNLIRTEVEEQGSKIVMIDSVSGYRISFADIEENLLQHLHRMAQYLRTRGVTTLLINEVESITGDFRATEVGISYLVDNIVFLRFLEIKGEMRKAIGVLKKRLSDFEKTLREIEITRYGIKVGKPLTQLRGILTGVPDFIDSDKHS